MDNEMPKQPTIEENFEKLEGILDRLEDEGTGLEESFKLYEEGLHLLKNVSDSIDKTEKKLQILCGDGSTEDLK